MLYPQRVPVFVMARLITVAVAVTPKALRCVKEAILASGQMSVRAVMRDKAGAWDVRDYVVDVTGPFSDVTVECYVRRGGGVGSPLLDCWCSLMSQLSVVKYVQGDGVGLPLLLC